MKHLSALDALFLQLVIAAVPVSLRAPGDTAHLEAAHAELLEIARTHAEKR